MNTEINNKLIPEISIISPLQTIDDDFFEDIEEEDLTSLGLEINIDFFNE